MTTIVKTIRGLDSKTIELIEQRANKLNVNPNDLIREVLNDYAKRIQEVESSKILHAQIDDLIEANNRLIKAQNDNTFAMGEIAKTILERLDYYLPSIDTNEIQKTRPKEKIEPSNFDLDNETFN
ncbi:hypothetical protein [Leuconostoc pseudomesenteroides]|uniref:hypothetical protein n=1 Tax=Leuconostoc pseudomesenteroides TaxID=33968 RepID=UPI002897D5BE|nr:hypothetical protein [Leuconostoc pseudomesenteroides]